MTRTDLINALKKRATQMTTYHSIRDASMEVVIDEDGNMFNSEVHVGSSSYNQWDDSRVTIKYWMKLVPIWQDHCIDGYYDERDENDYWEASKYAIDRWSAYLADAIIDEISQDYLTDIHNASYYIDETDFL